MLGADCDQDREDGRDPQHSKEDGDWGWNRAGVDHHEDQAEDGADQAAQLLRRHGGLRLRVGRAYDADQPTLGVVKLSHLLPAKDLIGTLHAPPA